jgi:glycosyltransferase involved in cell wall biosynthesis
VSRPALGKFDKSVSLLAWGYNEEMLVVSFLDRALALLEGAVNEFEIVFINDGSTDRTRELLDDYASREPRIRVFHNDRNRNVGYSIRRAIREARNEVLFWQTVDWSYDLKNVRIFLELTRHFDVVQGIRPVPERLLSHIPVLRSIYRVKSRSDNIRKAFVSLANYYILKTLFGLPFHDFQNVSFYPTKLIQSFEHKANSAFGNPEMLFKAYAAGANFIEVPIGFIPRNLGEAKGTKWRSIIAAIEDIAHQWLDWGWRFRWRHPFEKGRIQRVAQPFYLSDEVLEMILPLFKEYR